MKISDLLSKRDKKKLAKLLVALIITVVGAYIQTKSPSTDSATSPGGIDQVGMYSVISIADGDTITVDMEGKKEKIRFIGVDTPEIHHGGNTAPTQCYGDEAKKFVEDSIANKRVKLVADTKGSNRDRYGRLLRYVYNHEDKPIDELLVSGGYGFAIDGFAYSQKEHYLGLMDAAKQNKTGLWAVCEVDYSKGYPQIAE